MRRASVHVEELTSFAWQRAIQRGHLTKGRNAGTAEMLPPARARTVRRPTRGGIQTARLERNKMRTATIASSVKQCTDRRSSVATKIGLIQSGYINLSGPSGPLVHPTRAPLGLGQLRPGTAQRAQVRSGTA